MTEHQQITPPRKNLGDSKCLQKQHQIGNLELIKAVSGYGRELFFSNIINYIAKHCTEVITSALQELLPQNGFDKVERENRHMDLVFFGRDDKNNSTPVLVIENKQGSIATQEQLERYYERITKIKKSKSGKNSECTFLLISPHCFDKDVADKAGWSFMGYEELGQKLGLALGDYAEKKSGYSDTLEYKLLKAAIEYMPFLEKESTRVYNEVTSDLQCSDLRKEGDSADNIKLRYHAVAHLLISKLEDEGIFKKMEEQQLLTSEHKYFEASFDPGTSEPLVRMEVKELVKVKEVNANFSVFFQGDYLSIGFGMNDTYEDLGKNDKKKYRLDKWKEYDFANTLKQITGDSNSYYDYEGTGYMTTKYILTMYRINVRDKTVSEIVETMCRYAQGALDYHKKYNL